MQKQYSVLLTLIILLGSVGVGFAQCGDREEAALSWRPQVEGVEIVGLKTFDLEMMGIPEIPFRKTFSYVFSKDTDYYFFIKEFQRYEGRFEFKLYNHALEEVPIESEVIEGGDQYSYHCRATGIFYLIVYALEDTEACGKLELFFHREPRVVEGRRRRGNNPDD